MPNRLQYRQSPGGNDQIDDRQATLRRLKIAVVHDWLITYGGAERVLEQILCVVPQADLFALYDFTPDENRGYFQNKKVTTSFLQKLPLARRKYRSYLPLMPLAVEQFDLSAYDLVITSSHAVAHGVLTNAEQLHVSYFNNTMVYAWDLYHHYLNSSGLNRGAGGLLARLILHYIRTWDAASGDRVDHYIANSAYMARRIDKLYGRTSSVIYPPVDVDKFALQETKDDYYVSVSRLVPFKRIDLIVDAFKRMPNRKLIVIGDGPEMAGLEKRAGANVRFIGFQNQSVVHEYVRQARGFIFSSAEPFGIAVVEAQACGTPVIALAKGAAPEIITGNEQGVMFEESSPEAIIAAVEQGERSRSDFDPAAMRRNAERFSAERFRHELADTLSRLANSFFAKPSLRATDRYPIEEKYERLSV